MRSTKTLYMLTGILTLVLALPLSGAFAGSTGKISGRITDAQGAPLPGSSVVIEGTQRGAITDADGFYVIVAVDPGTYDLTASLVGFANVTKRNVNVTVDYTTTLSFTLKEQAIEAAEIVVTAERSPVEADKTSTRYVLSVEDIEQTPIVKTTGEFISLQPGVDQAGTFSVRGSKPTQGTHPSIARGWNKYSGGDVNVMVDGVRIPHNDGNSALLFTGVNKSAIQQISVETGVTPAEYGDAQAGTVNIVMKDGGRAVHGWTEVNLEPGGQKHWGTNVYDAPSNRDHMKWDDPEWLKETDPQTGRIIHVREDYTSYQGVRLEGSLSGPIGPKASFIVSAKHDRRAATYPSATSHGFYNDRGQYINAPDNFQGSASLTFKPTGGIKVKAGLILQRYTAFNNEYNHGNQANHGFIRGVGRASGRNIFLPSDWASSGKYRHQENLAYVTFTHTISSKTFYEVRLARSQTVNDTMDTHPWSENPRNDRAGWFYIDREVASWVDTDRKRYSIKADLSSQLTRGNFVKTGFEIIRYNTYYTFWSSGSKTANRFTMSAGGDTPWIMDTPAKPIRGAFYVQDKMEFEGLIANLGVRLDFNKHTHKELMFSGMHTAPMWKFYTHRHYAYGVGTGDGVNVTGDMARTPPTQFYISPRLGVSHPVTDRMKLHFSLGRFLKWLSVYDSYSKSYRNAGKVGPDGDPSWKDVNGNGVKDPAEALNVMQHPKKGNGGDPWAHPEQTMTFEVGADWNFVSDYTASLAIWYRSETDKITGEANRWEGPKVATTIRGQANGRGAYVKGFDIMIRKRLSNYFSFRLAWTSSWSAAGDIGLTQYRARMHPDSSFVVSPEFWYKFKPMPDGSEVAIALTEAEKVKFGSEAERYVRNSKRWYKDAARTHYGRMPEFPDDKGMYMKYMSLGGFNWGPLALTGQERTGGRLGQANAQFVLHTPPDVRFGPRWMSWLASDLNANLLWRLRTGIRIKWKPPGGGTVFDRGPIVTLTDLGVEKVFNSKGRVRPSFFVEVRNLFDQKTDITNPGAKYMQRGQLMPDPDNKDFVTYGDMGDRDFAHAPRQTNLGIRVSF